MAHTSRNPSTELPQRVHDALSASLADPDTHAYVVAFSGGVDSSVLLHACVQLELDVRAVHIHHGLQSEADDWQQHCASVCESLHVDFQAISVNAHPVTGESPEAAARQARYQALLATMQGEEVLLLAQHRDDQAETVLLQLMRGAGPAGLSAMPRSNVRETADGRSVTVLRPLLDCSREQIEDYARDHGLIWVEDPSNEDTSIRRNAVRHSLMPVLKQLSAGIDAQLAQVAAQQQHSAALLDELARIDLAQCIGSSTSRLQLGYLLALSARRQFNLLRYWLHASGTRPNRKCLQQIINDVLTAEDDAMPQVRWANSVVCRFDDNLYLLPAAMFDEHDSRSEYRWSPAERLLLSNGRSLEARTVVSDGLHSRYLEDELVVRFRRGGERIRLRGRAQHHDLKKLFQQARVPPWERDRMPLLYCGDELLAVGSHWLAENHCSPEGESGWQPVVCSNT